jgi:hypothetical protein
MVSVGVPVVVAAAPVCLTIESVRLGPGGAAAVTANVSEPMPPARGSIVTVYVSVAGRVTGVPVAVGPVTTRKSSCEPSEAVRSTSATGIVLADTPIVTCWPAVPSNVRVAFSPGVAIVTVVSWPIAVCPVLSGTRLRVTDIEPVAAPTGSTTSVYVPATAGSWIVSPKAVAPEANHEEPTEKPSGPSTSSRAPVIVLPEIDALRASPPAAENVRSATSPGVPIAIDSGTPISIVPMFSGTVRTENVSEPTFASNGSTTSEYTPVLGATN